MTVTRAIQRRLARLERLRPATDWGDCPAPHLSPIKLRVVAAMLLEADALSASSPLARQLRALLAMGEQRSDQ